MILLKSVGKRQERKESMHIHIKSFYIRMFHAFVASLSILVPSFGTSAVGVGPVAETADTGGSGC